MAEAIIKCGSCDANEISRPADIWCQHCDEGLCSACQHFHNSSKFTRNHKTIPIRDYGKLPSDILQITDVCSEHNEKFIMYCHLHLKPCCRTCIIENHNSCKNLAKIENVIQNYKSSVSFRDLEISLQDSRENVTKLKEDRKNNLKLIATDTKKALEEVRNVRRKINQHLDYLQERITNELKQKEDEAKSAILDTITLLDKEESLINEIFQTVSNIKSYASDLQTFLYTTKIEEQVHTTENRLLELFKGGACSTSKIIVYIKTLIKTFADDLSHFGTAEVCKTPSVVVLKRRKEGEAQKLAQLSRGRQIEDINLSVDGTIGKIGGTCYGCGFLSGGRMIFTKNDEHMIKFLYTYGSEEFSIKTPGKPYDVTQVNDTILVVSHGFNGGISTINLKTKKVIESLLPGHKINGITTKGENHIIFCQEGIGVRVVHIGNGRVTHIVKDSTLPFDCYVASFGNTVIHTNAKTNTVACHDINGTMIWSFKDDNILRGPRGVTTDQYGNVFVAGLDSDNLVIISADGKKHKQVGSDVIIIKARCLHYDPKNDRLLVSSGKGEFVVLKID